MNKIKQLIESIKRFVRRFIGLSPVDIDKLSDLKEELDIQKIFDHMPNYLYNIEQRLTEPPSGDISFEEGLKSKDTTVRVITADSVVHAYMTGATIKDALLTTAIYVLLDGLSITVKDVGQYRLLVDEARNAFKNQNEKGLEKAFDKQDKLLASLTERTIKQKRESKGHA